MTESSNSTASESTINRVRALIAKAESSPFPAEATAFMAKAQFLIDQYAIDQARLKGVDPSTVGHEELDMAGTYTTERATIWGVVAQANRCTALTMSQYGSRAVTSMTLIGRREDREFVKLVSTSLELQAVRQMKALETDRAWASPVVQRRSFLRGFANEINQRLIESKRHQQAFGSAATTLELASSAVDHYTAEHFDVTERRSQSQLDGASFSRGRRAGANADVGSTRLRGGRRAIQSAPGNPPS